MPWPRRSSSAAKTKVECGRLYFCTSAGGFAEHVVPLDESSARTPPLAVAETIGDAIGRPFLPAAPADGQCQWCDYRAVCGPYEEQRTARKPKGKPRAAPDAAGDAMTDLADAEARRRILTDFGTTLFVEAAAGTGKTTVLVGRIVALDSRRGEHARPHRRGDLHREGGRRDEAAAAHRDRDARGRTPTPRSRARLERALSELELARIGTIHAFCGDLLRERPVEAGDRSAASRLPPRTKRRNWRTRRSSAGSRRRSPTRLKASRRILRRRSKRQRPRDALATRWAALIEHRDFPALATRPIRSDGRDRRFVGAAGRASERWRAESSWPDDYLARNLAEIARFVARERPRRSGARPRLRRSRSVAA